MNYPSSRAMVGLCASFAIQNIEETILLPQWLRMHFPAAPYLTQWDYGIATGLLTIALVGLCIYVSEYHRRSDLLLMALTLAAGALVANAATHILLSAVTVSLMPGAISGLLLQGPIGLIVLNRIGLDIRQMGPVILTGLVLTPFAAGAALLLAKILEAPFL